MTAPTIIDSVAASYYDNGGGANGTNSGSRTTTGAKRLIVAIVSQASAPPTVTDNKGNTYSVLSATAQSSAYPSYTTVFASQANPTVGTGHTVTVASTGGYPTLTMWAVAPQAAGALSLEVVAQNDTATPYTTPAITASAALLLAWSVPAAGADLTATWSNSFTALTAKLTGDVWQACSASRRVETSGAYSASLTYNTTLEGGRHYLIAVHEAVASTATIKRWNGSAFTDSQVKYWNGSAWIDPVAVRVWNGSAWIEQ